MNDTSKNTLGEDGQDYAEERVQIDPDEPDCRKGREHDWRSPHSLLGGCKENPGVVGHGGGVICTEVCCHCGAYRTTDTWAQDRETGEQGLESVEYRSADDDSLAYVRRKHIESGEATATVDVSMAGPLGHYVASFTVGVDSDGECGDRIQRTRDESEAMDSEQIRDENEIWLAIEDEIRGSAADGGEGETEEYWWTIETVDPE